MDHAMPPKKRINFKKYNENGMIVVFGRFNQNMWLHAHEQFEAATQAAVKRKKNHAHIIIDSPGGAVTTLNRMIGCMHLYRPKPDFKYVGHVINKCCSAAFILLQYCDWRVSLSMSQFMFHFGRTELTNSSLSTLLTNSDQFLSNFNSRLNYLITTVAARSGQSHERLARIAQFDTLFSAQSALELNFIDEIVQSVPTASTNIEDRPAS
jgi:ATP-dependent protease ClpP protease subunit